MTRIVSPQLRLLGFVLTAATLWSCASPNDNSPAVSQAATAPVPVDTAAVELSAVQGIAMGEEDAPVVVYEFADFQCPACAQVATYVTPMVKERFVDSGRVRYVYYDFPLVSIHPQAFLAARAGRCAHEQGRFWEYHDLLYQQQAGWSGTEDAIERFSDYASQAGLDTDGFNTCLRSDRYAEEVSRSLLLAESLGLRGTPTLFVNGKQLARIPTTPEEWEALIQAETGGPSGS